MKRCAAMLLIAFAIPAMADSVHVVAANNASCDIGTYAAATLLLPFFDVDLSQQSNSGVDTVFTIINTSKYPQIARVTLWTDLGYPAVWFSDFLTGYDAQTISLYEILARGDLPVSFGNVAAVGPASLDNKSNPNFQSDPGCSLMGGPVSVSQRQAIQKVFTTGMRDGSDCPVGTVHDRAIGYVTVDVVSACSAIAPTDPAYFRTLLLYDNVLTGDYERINPNTVSGNYAGGNPLVHIRAIPEGGPAGTAANVPMQYTFYDRYTPPEARKLDRRQPLPSSFAARFIEGGPTGFLTNFAVWREGVVGGTLSECEYAKNARLLLPKVSVVRFDEHENATALAADEATPPVAIIATERSSLLPPTSGSGDHAGWVWMSLDNGAGHAQTNNPYSIVRPSQAWVVIQMYAEGRYAVDFDATSLANGCTMQPPAVP